VRDGRGLNSELEEKSVLDSSRISVSGKGVAT